MVFPVLPLKIVCRNCDYHTVLYPVQEKYNFSRCPRCDDEAWKYRHATFKDKLKKPAAWFQGRRQHAHH
jgi:predicted Zn-ribbon and HTH transcriptional regulator